MVVAVGLVRQRGAGTRLVRDLGAAVADAVVGVGDLAIRVGHAGKAIGEVVGIRRGLGGTAVGLDLRLPVAAWEVCVVGARDGGAVVGVADRLHPTRSVVGVSGAGAGGVLDRLQAAVLEVVVLGDAGRRGHSTYAVAVVEGVAGDLAVGILQRCAVAVLVVGVDQGLAEGICLRLQAIEGVVGLGCEARSGDAGVDELLLHHVAVVVVAGLDALDFVGACRNRVGRRDLTIQDR